MEFPVLDTEALLELQAQRARLIDVRPIDAYNGWCLRGEPRGGHIPGAKALPAKWADYLDWIEIVRHKQIQPDETLILYGYTPEESRRVARRFRQAGYEKIWCYDDFLTAYVPEGYPLERLPRYRHLVPAVWVKGLLEGLSVPEYDNDRFIIVHAHYRNRDAYLSGHIPGAIDMDTLALEAPETWNRRAPDELKAALEAHGITADTTVVLYGKFMFPRDTDPFPGSAAGQLGAMRLAFIMIYAGVRDVRVLNGGFQAWIDAGYPISTDDVPKRPVADFGAPIPAHPELAVDTPEAKQMLAAPDAELVCVRSYREYIGEVSGYNYIEAKGRIPGAIFADCGRDAYHMDNYRNVDHTTREYHEIDAIWRRNGITPDKHLAFYCGTGWRGSEAWFNAWLMGWPRVSVYDGGWFEWSRDPGNPIEVGVPAG
ncbi:rhodanese-like domain-containing protein [Rhodothermus marinus]|uniref:rhodanese-like domain-containing protein n=1 Tax=Rhodothermus marinus TaxID=29549 RepID=UPI0037CB34C2